MGVKEVLLRKGLHEINKTTLDLTALSSISHTHTRMHAHAHAHVHARTHMYVCIYICIYLSIIHTCTHVPMRACTHPEREFLVTKLTYQFMDKKSELANSYCSRLHERWKLIKVSYWNKHSIKSAQYSLIIGRSEIKCS